MHTRTRQPWDAPALTIDERRAIRALARGAASDRQQTLALDCIIKNLSGYYGLSVSGPDATAAFFADGRRYVGAALVGVINSSETANPPAPPAETKG